MDNSGVTSRRNWTRAETLVAFNLYSRTPFGRLHAKNLSIVEIASRLNRTPSAVAMKCCNLASLDPFLQARGVKGLSGISKLDREIWLEFHNHSEMTAYESELAYSKAMGREPRMTPAEEPVVFAGGTDRQAVRRIRVTQHLFREMIMAGYGTKCAVCTLPTRELLVASHIVGWAADESNRMNPRNGICLCSIHDKAFDTGILDVDEDFVVRITKRCKIDKSHRATKDMLYRFNGTTLTLSERWQPDPVLLLRRRQLLGLNA